MTRVETKAHRWIVGDDTGSSSEAIWAHMMGVSDPDRGWSHPYDPADFGRCARLLKFIPEWRRRLRGMAKRSKAWAQLVQHWDEIEVSMEREVGIDWSKGRSAPKTYELMQKVMGRHKWTA